MTRMTATATMVVMMIMIIMMMKSRFSMELRILKKKVYYISFLNIQDLDIKPVLFGYS